MKLHPFVPNIYHEFYKNLRGNYTEDTIYNTDIEESN